MTPAGAADRGGSTYVTVEQAAEKLAMTPCALRCRCRRAQLRDKRTGKVEAPLGDGVVAVKFGRSWRIRFPQSQAA